MKYCKKLIILSFLCLCCHVLHLCHGTFQDRKNVLIVVDSSLKDVNTVHKVVSEILDSISLLKCRIGLYSTNGLSQTILSFQSRECSRKIMKHRRLRQHISHTLKIVGKELAHFWKDKNIIVVITSSHNVHDLRTRLNQLGIGSQNEANYIIQLQRLKNGHIQNILWKSVHLSSWKRTKIGSEVFDDFMKKIFHWLHFTQETLDHCMPSGKKTVDDECHRQCQCVNGKLTNCYRLRQQFSALSLAKRLHYINVYKATATDKRFQRYFYNLLLIHPNVDFERVHNPGELFPFHRKYVLKMENLFRLLDCRTTIPYWNFAIAGKKVFQSAPGYHIWDKTGGLGGTKTHAINGYCIETGPFRYPLYKFPGFLVNKLSNTDRRLTLCPPGSDSRYKKCYGILKKTFKPDCPTRFIQNINKIQTYSNVYWKLHNKKTKFSEFQEYISQDCHGVIHDNMGGDFSSGYSSLLPEFFLLHSFIDAMWDYWQQNRKDGSSLKWLKDKKKKIIGFHTPRFWYVDNSNLEECGVKIKYTNIFPNTPPKEKKKKSHIMNVGYVDGPNYLNDDEFENDDDIDDNDVDDDDYLDVDDDNRDDDGNNDSNNGDIDGDDDDRDSYDDNNNGSWEENNNDVNKK